MQVTKGEDGRYYKPCPECGEMQSYLRKNYAQESLRLKKACKACSNKKTDNCHRGWHRGIRLSWFNKFKTGAETRGLDWDLSLDDIADLMELQQNKCALTGWSIEFPESGHPQQALASIDRIDSELGYVKGNVQLLTRQVNMMKLALASLRSLAEYYVTKDTTLDFLKIPFERELFNDNRLLWIDI